MKCTFRCMLMVGAAFLLGSCAEIGSTATTSDEHQAGLYNPQTGEGGPDEVQRAEQGHQAPPNSIRAKYNLKDHYEFTDNWFWQYTDYEGNKGEMGVAHHPESGIWLFTQDSYGDTDGMSDWILGLPNGTYLLGYKDPEAGSKKQILELKADFDIDEDLRKLWKRTNKTAVFGHPRNSREKFKGTAYDVTYPRLSDRSIVYVGETSIDFRPVYYFNELDSDARLPFHFPNAIRKNELVLADSTVHAGGTTSAVTFSELSPTSYHVYVSDYDN